MTREHKLALILGFAITLVVGMLLSDHFSKASQASLASPAAAGAAQQAAQLQPSGAPAPRTTAAAATSQPAAAPLLDGPLPPADAASLRDPLAAGPAVADQTQGATLADLGAPRRSTAPAPLQQTAFTPAAQLSLRSAAQAPPPAAATRRHVVRQGETLWSICVAVYGDGSLHRRLALYNRDRLAPDGSLRAGTTLLLPPRSMLTGAEAPPPQPSPPAAQAQQRVYVVQPGDTLSAIALRTLGSVRRMDEILQLNRDVVEDADDIRPGMTLKLPAR